MVERDQRTLPEHGGEVNVKLAEKRRNRTGAAKQFGRANVPNNRTNLNAVFHADTIGGMLVGVKTLFLGWNRASPLAL